MGNEKDILLATIEEVRIILLNVHKNLIDIGRLDYERLHGEIKNPGNWVVLLVQDKFFKWLHPISFLITSIDQLLEIKMPISQKDATAVRAEIENLIMDFPSTPVDFRTHYLDMMQREPSVVMLHAKLKHSIQTLPKPDPEKMTELLSIRHQWAAANQLKYTKKIKDPI